jgi:hypothetical protein
MMFIGASSRWKAPGTFREAAVPTLLTGALLCHGVAQQSSCRAKLDAGPKDLIAKSLESSPNGAPPARQSLF